MCCVSAGVLVSFLLWKLSWSVENELCAKGPSQKSLGLFCRRKKLRFLSCILECSPLSSLFDVKLCLKLFFFYHEGKLDSLIVQTFIHPFFLFSCRVLPYFSTVSTTVDLLNLSCNKKLISHMWLRKCSLTAFYLAPDKGGVLIKNGCSQWWNDNGAFLLNSAKAAPISHRLLHLAALV